MAGARDSWRMSLFLDAPLQGSSGGNGCGQAAHGLRIHAPTVSFPVAEFSLMIEPTGSEVKGGWIDCVRALIAIRGEEIDRC